MLKYEPARFASTYEKESGSEIWNFLNEPESIIRMETATYLSRPAIESLSPFLLNRFGERIRKDRIKQMAGHMVRQVLENNGYRVDRNNVRINREGNIFSSATRYVSSL